MYENVDSWICENVFDSATPESLVRAKSQAEIAEKFGVNAEQLKQMLEALGVGKMTTAQYDSELSKAIETAQAHNLETKFDALFKAYTEKHRAQ
jgi:hypothetical protein